MNRLTFIFLLLLTPFAKACNINNNKINKKMYMETAGKTGNDAEVEYEVRRADGSLKEKRIEKIENGKTVSLKSDFFDENGKFIKSKES